MAQKHNEKIEAMQVEAEAVAKFLFGLDLKVHKTQLVVEIPNGAGKKRAINCNWVSGTNLHFAVLANKEKILKMVPTMEGHKSFNGLGSIADSQNLIMALISYSTIYTHRYLSVKETCIICCQIYYKDFKMQTH